METGITAEDCLNIENIDRKKVNFTAGSIYLKDKQTPCYLPELIIIKNEKGKILFNKIAHRLKKAGAAKEKNIELIEGRIEFPYYVLSMDVISCGLRWGRWEHYGNNSSALAEEIELDNMMDDFISFKDEIECLLI
jgi:hypothetical protein